jgi:CheY-like chemotaxis protein
LTNQLLAFARGGKYEVKPTDLNEIVRKSSEMFGRTKKEIGIYVKLQEGVWSVEADQSQIEQVMLNLYVNAWQSMPGGGELYLETENVVLNVEKVKPWDLEPGRYVKVSIADTGAGMDQATQDRVFDPFFTTKEMGRGTGLGLASAYGIIKNHDGLIRVSSEKGKGATFDIYLPASEKKVVKKKKLDKELLKGDETILLVDDEDMIIEIGKELLKKIGYKVLIATTGKSAVELYRTNKEEIDMIILDMIMPGMGGGETFDQLYKINPKIKVLLSSGYSINGQATEIIKRGCRGFIQKPFSIRDLSQKLREIIDAN